MFAVKGWSLDPASLKPQTEIFKSSKQQGSEPQKSKKRKRGHAHEAKEGTTNGEDVGQLWDEHVEGKDASKKSTTKERKRQKLDQVTVKSVDYDEAPDTKKRKPKGDKDLDGVVAADLVEKKGKKAKRRPREQERVVKEADAANEVSQNGTQKASEPKTTTQDVPPPPPPTSAKLTPMQSAMRQKLISARFRHLNQTLYTEPSLKALELFAKNPEMFEDYHAGFRQQVSVWPENPLDNFIAEIRQRGKVKPPKREKKRRKPHHDTSLAPLPLPRTHGIGIIADLGCGDARLAHTLKTSGDTTKLNLQLHSFDLHSPSPLVTKADISNLPLANDSVDVAIFCLALMGTNWISFIEEAYRILHWKGELWVAEIKSRFGRAGKGKSAGKGKPVEHSVGSKRKVAALKAVKEAKKREEAKKEVNEDEVLQTEVDGVTTAKEETDVGAFVDVLKRRGFALKAPADLGNKMFVKMEFVKALTPVKGKGVPKEQEVGGGGLKAKKKFIPELDDEVMTEDEAGVLKPCLYKIR